MRVEEDFLGKVNVPDNAYYGSFTSRAHANFKLSGIKVHHQMIVAVAIIKKCAAKTNVDLARLDGKIGGAIVKAADEVISGKLDSEFILDAFQAGAGTPLHMNVNEVIANRAEELLGGKKGEYKLVHPNNHVNMSQSSNNVVPSAVKIAALKLAATTLNEAKMLEEAFSKKANRYKNTMKIGRTHLQDAVPMTYGQVFEAYQRAIEKDRHEIESALDGLLELGVGGTAIGSGITAHPKFREKLIAQIKKETGLFVKVALNGIEITQNMNDFLSLSAALRRYATTLSRIANDLRLLVSGPNAGIAEIVLEEVEPGSSIMPGKVNPSIPEAVNMVSFLVVGNDHAIMMAVASGQLELNFATPLIAYCLLQNLEILSNCTIMFRRCIDRLEVDEKKTKENFERTFGYATALNPYLGYSRVSKLVKEAYQRGISLKELVIEKGIMNKVDLEKILSITGPSEIDKKIKIS